MAITIKQSPNHFSPVYNPLPFVITSSNVAQPNFKFIYDIHIGSDLVRIKQSPRPDGYGYLDVHRVVESYVTSDFTFSVNNLFARNSHSYVKFTVAFGEEYGTTPTVHANLTTTSAKYSWNASLDMRGEYQDFDYTEFIIGGSASPSVGRFLTNAPKTQLIGENQGAYLYFINAGSAVNSELPGYLVQFYFYDKDGNVIGTQQSVQNSFHAVSDANYFARVAVGTRDWNEFNFTTDLFTRNTDVEYFNMSTFFTGDTLITADNGATAKLISDNYPHMRVRELQGNWAAAAHITGSPSGCTADVATVTRAIHSYTAQLLDASTPDGLGSSEMFTYVIDESCSPYETVRLHFLNKLGGFDSYNFRRKAVRTMDVIRSNYTKLMQKFDTSAEAMTFPAEGRGNVQFNTVTTNKIVVNSGWITDEEAVWLNELFSSPEIYIEEPTRIMPVNISNKDYETKNRAKDKLFSIQCELVYSTENNRQRF